VFAFPSRNVITTAEELAKGLGPLYGTRCVTAQILLASMAGTPLSANMFHRVPTRRASVLAAVKRRAAPAQSASGVGGDVSSRLSLGA